MLADKLPLLNVWMLHNGRHYRVIWSEEDGEFVGVCQEEPYMSHLSEDYTEAFLGIIDLVETDWDSLKPADET